MSTPPSTEQDTAEVPCLLLPIVGTFVLLPTVTVAEIVPYTKPAPETQVPPWYLGALSWRNRPLPLLSLEVMAGADTPSLTSSGRVAVLNSIGVSQNLPFIAILVQGIPRLIRVNPDNISETANAHRKTFERMHVALDGEIAVIPDMELLERSCLNLHQ